MNQPADRSPKTSTANRAAVSPRPARMTLPDARTAWIVAGVLVLACIGALVWGFGQQSELDDARAENQRLTEELATVRQNANATLYELTPTSQGPANASASAFMSLRGSGILGAFQLPQPGDGQAYQLWYLPGNDEAPIPGGTFGVDETGTGFMLIPADVGAFRALSISLEPEGGSATPTGSFILTGAVSGARG